MRVIGFIVALLLSSTVLAQSDFITHSSNNKYLFSFIPTAAWPGKVTWYYNSTNAPVELPDSKVLETMQVVINKWAKNCNIKVQYGGKTSVRPETTNIDGGADKINVLGWGTMPNGFAGYTVAWSDEHDSITPQWPKYDHIIDADIVIGPQTRSIDGLEPLLLHEFGHFIGIGHSDINNASMSGPPHSYYNSLDLLSVDDVNGCRKLYGPFEDLPEAILPVQAVEFYHATFDHYFMSIDQNEINALDKGFFTGWKRTGYKFKAFPVAQLNTEPICRFYLPPPEDSHFYSADAAECERVKQEHPTFILESTSVMHVIPVNMLVGRCPNNTIPVYRLWNNRPDTNHRYTSSPNIKSQMMNNGYIAEGVGENAVIFCVPL